MNAWRKYNGALIPKHPAHVSINENIGEIKNLISDTGSFFARWTSDFDIKEETEFWHVICDQNLAIEEYSVNTRSKIKRGMKNCSVRMITKQELIKNGYEVYKEAYLKYKTYNSPTLKSLFVQDIKFLGEEWHFWGVFYEEKLIAYCMSKIESTSCNYSTIKFHPKYLRLYSSYALFYTMNCYYLNEMKLKYVNDGTRNLVHKTNIQDFLITKFGFRKAYCKLHVQYNVFFKFIVILIYPLRFVFHRFNNRFAVKINSLLFQEKIRRSFL
tara:strand:- start:361 stop:1170 length:810 start_codon:yes stop_codon:yes gene_type:complete